MARTVASLPPGSRITDYISLGVLAKTFPLDKVTAVVAAAGKTNRRQRDLPAPVVVYYVIALTLYMQVSYREVLRCLLEGIRWLLGPQSAVKIAGKSGISQARTRLGWEPLQQLHDEVVTPIAGKQTKGAGIASGARLAWTAAPWMWPTKKKMRRPSDGNRRVAAPAPTHSYALSRWWRTERTCYSARNWERIATRK